MHKKVLLDTDVCLDALTDREPFNLNAQHLLYLSESSQVEALVTSVSFSNMYYLIKRWMNSSKAYHLLFKLSQIVSIADVTSSEVENALNSKWNDFEDSLQYYAAVSNKCTCLITRNISDYKQSDIPIFTPSEFIEETS